MKKDKSFNQDLIRNSIPRNCILVYFAENTSHQCSIDIFSMIKSIYMRNQLCFFFANLLVVNCKSCLQIKQYLIVEGIGDDVVSERKVYMRCPLCDIYNYVLHDVCAQQQSCASLKSCCTIRIIFDVNCNNNNNDIALNDIECPLFIPQHCYHISNPNKFYYRK